MNKQQKLKKVIEIRKRILEIKKSRLEEKRGSDLFAKIMTNITTRDAEDMIEKLRKKNPKLAKKADRLRANALDLKQSMEKDVSVSANL